ncbi:NS1 [Penicillium discovirus]|uniref:NS1 n=1 Tax=Penicillium discovirus TaxID=2185132 RepID=A0A4Y1LTA3_9VIRU|nr:NS1 [Penicillium discovirus]AWN00472.1 NS1 [Penicillium discovirus]
MASYDFSPSLLNGLQGVGSEVKNPFADPSNLSRTTASGFTDSDCSTMGLNVLQRHFQDLLHERAAVDNMPEGVDKKEAFAITNQRINDVTMELLKLDILNQNQRKANESSYATPPSSPPKNGHGFNPTQRNIEDDIVSCLTMNTIRPNDSASVIKPQKQGTELTMYSGIRSSLIRGSDHDNVVGGYDVSAEDHMAELDAIKNIQRVYGLPKIFLDDRLNFLVHLHKPLQTMLTTTTDSKVKYPDANSLEKLTRFIEKNKGRHREPHHELVYQVFKATIDVRRQRVKANPFNLPIIEIGMNLDDQLIYMCISELYSEFRTLWFHSMKNVEPPHFASDYVGVGRPAQRVTRQRAGTKGKRRGSSSLLGSILS